MKKSLNHLLLVSTTLALLSSCASYKAAPLNSLSSELIESAPVEERSPLQVAAKAFTKDECNRYLGRDVIAKGYQPVQIYIQNETDKSYFFSLNRIDLPHARPEEVATKVHTSTVGRVLGYGIPGLILLWPLLVPAVVDGIKSSDANTALDVDYSCKVARDQVINPYSYYNKVLFVPTSDYQASFHVTLIDQQSNTPTTFDVIAR
jgi:hypothetical protein